MNIQYKQTKIYLILAALLTLTLLLVPFPHQQNIKGVVGPMMEYHLITDGAGSFSNVLVDHWTDELMTSQSFRPERGGLMSYESNLVRYKDGQVQIGDTLGWIRSSEVQAEIARLEGNIATLKASLAFERSGSRQTVIEGARLRLAYATTRYEERRKILERSADLLNRNIISQQEYDDDESKERLDSIRISIAEADLASALAGAQTAKLDVIHTQIMEEEHKLALQQKLMASLTLTSPLDGQVYFPLDGDTLFSIRQNDVQLILIPVNTRDMNTGQFQDRIVINMPGGEQVTPASEIWVSDEIYSIGSDQMVILKARMKHEMDPLPVGQRLDVVVKENAKSVLSHILDLF